MEKYNKQLIIDYISGNNIENYDLNELENDRLFMTKVIEYSNDEKMYNFCSDELKQDYEFIKYVILKFRNNIQFITEVADCFLDNTNTDLERTELVIIMDNLTQNNEKNVKYKMLSEVIFSGKRLEIELGKRHLNDENTSNEIGMGFLLIYDSYMSSEIVLNYYATKIIEDIFKEYDIDLERMLHSKFKNANQINEQGLNNYMINFISLYDPMLSSYLCTHLNLLIPLKNKIISIQNNWDKYNDKEEIKKFNLIIERVHDYVMKHDSMFSEEFLLYHISNSLGISEKMAKYDRISEELYEAIMQNLSDEFVEQTFSVSIEDRIHYNNVKKIITSILQGKELDFTDEVLETDKNKSKARILKINFNKDKK